MPRGWGTKYEYRAPPRKAMSAYSFYVQDWYRYHRRIMRTRNPHRVIREVGRAWKSLEQPQKDKYIVLAKKDKQRARAEKIEYYRMIDSNEVELPALTERVTKQPGYPRSTKNAFVYFSNDIRDKIRQENPNMPYKEVMREMARRWQKLPKDERKPYEQRRDRDKNRYGAAKSEFKIRKKDVKKKKRIEDGRARLNRLFNQKVPGASIFVPPHFQAEQVADGDAAPAAPVVPPPAPEN